MLEQLFGSCIHFLVYAGTYFVLTCVLNDIFVPRPYYLPIMMLLPAAKILFQVKKVPGRVCFSSGGITFSTF